MNMGKQAENNSTTCTITTDWGETLNFNMQPGMKMDDNSESGTSALVCGQTARYPKGLVLGNLSEIGEINKYEIENIWNGYPAGQAPPPLAPGDPIKLKDLWSCVFEKRQTKCLTNGTAKIDLELTSDNDPGSGPFDPLTNPNCASAAGNVIRMTGPISTATCPPGSGNNT